MFDDTDVAQHEMVATQPQGRAVHERARADVPKTPPAPAQPGVVDAASTSGNGAPAMPARRNTGRLAKMSVGALLVGGVISGTYLWLENASHFATTDDAFIAARQFAIAPKVAGYIAAVPVTDNQHVAKGAVIARIDDRDYLTALAQSHAQVASAEASIRNITAEISVQVAQVAQDTAQEAAQRANLTFAQQQAWRYGILAHEGWGTKVNVQNWSSQLLQGEAGVHAAQASSLAALRQINVLKAELAAKEASLAEAQAQLDQARLNLSYTVVTAAQPGRIVQLSAATGQYAQPGTALTMFVPDDVWVVANFKENQIDRMRAGDAATLRLDAYPERALRGHVASVQAGSGTAFSLLPAENATGNYVKIVQRVPVKIVLDAPPADVAIGPGMSVVPSVRVDARPSLIETLRGVL